VFEFIKRLLGGGTTGRVELDVVEQIALAFIASFPETTEHAVLAEVSLRRNIAGWAEVYPALQKLRRNGLITEHRVKEDPARRYKATDQGKSIARHIPAEPGSMIEFRL
jgi:DNA-binding PadR family transcriptional regulator